LINLALQDIDPEFAHVKFGALALQKLINEYSFNSVLDIGCGIGQHLDIFSRKGKIVTGHRLAKYS